MSAPACADCGKSRDHVAHQQDAETADQHNYRPMSAPEKEER